LQSWILYGKIPKKTKSNGYTVFAVSKIKRPSKMYFKPNGDIQYEDPRLHTKANLRAGYESLFKHFKECSKTNIDRFHKKLMKVDVYKVGDKNKFDVDTYMNQQPRYRLGHARDEFFDSSIYGLTKNQVHVLRFIEVSLLSPDTASEMLSIAKRLGSKLSVDTLLFLNIGAHTSTKYMMDNMRLLAKTSYEQGPGFEETYFLVKRKDVTRTFTSAMTFQLLQGIDHYYNDYTLVDFADIIEDTEASNIFWNTNQDLSPIQILMGKYLRFLNEYISSDDDFVFDHEANLVAAFGLGHVPKSRKSFRWCESYERTGPEKYTSDESQKVYNYLSKNKKSVTVPISFTAYLDELFLNYKTEYNAYKMYFLKNPKQYVYELFYDKEFVPTGPQKKRKLQNTEETNSAKKKKGDTVDGDTVATGQQTEPIDTVVDDNQTAEDVPVAVESETTVDNTGHKKTTLDKISEYNIELKNINNPSRKILEIIRKVPFIMEIVINDMNDAEKTAFFNAFKSSIHDYVVEETAKLEKERGEI
jgi:hypothetical protein